MTPITDAEIAELRAGLEGVSPGPWVWGMRYICQRPVESGYRFLAQTAEGETAAEGSQWELNAAHIARCSPDKIAALLARLDAAEGELARMTNNRDMWKGQCERQADSLMKLRLGGVALLEAARLVSAYGAQTGSQWVKLSAAIPQMSDALAISKAEG